MRNQEVTTELLDKFQRYMVPISLEEPIIVQGSGCEVQDIRGRRYLDLAAGPGVVNFGHCHPRITEAIRDQAGRLAQSPGKYITPPVVELAAALAACTPDKLHRTFFCNSGAEAIEGAIKLAKKYGMAHQRGAGLIAFEHAFHGRLTHALSVTGQIKYKIGLDTYLTVPGIVHVPSAYPLRSPGGPSGCTDYVIGRVRDAIRTRAQGSIVALICEPIQAVGGVIVPPDDFLPELRRVCDEHDILLILDEVYTAFGRTGAMFACQHWGVTPDIMTLAKAIGGGLPLGAFVTTDEIAAAFAERKEHFTTFGGNSAISCAAGLAALRVIVEENLAEKARAAGNRLLGMLREAAEGVSTIAEVRGKGLLIGLEFAEDDKQLTPRPDLAARFQARALEQGLLVSVTGTFNSVIRLSPPLTISEDQLATAARVLRSIVHEIGK